MKSFVTYYACHCQFLPPKTKRRKPFICFMGCHTFTSMGAYSSNWTGVMVVLNFDILTTPSSFQSVQYNMSSKASSAKGCENPRKKWPQGSTFKVSHTTQPLGRDSVGSISLLFLLTSFSQQNSVFTIKSCWFDSFQFCIDPVYSFLCQVNRQTIRPYYVYCNDLNTSFFSSIHRNLLNCSWFSPVGPIQESSKNCAREFLENTFHAAVIYIFINFYPLYYIMTFFENCYIPLMRV